jgi:hypothetical protein
MINLCDCFAEATARSYDGAQAISLARAIPAVQARNALAATT